LWEAFEEDAHPPPSDVQTGQSIRFSKRRWQELPLVLDYIAQKRMVNITVDVFSSSVMGR